MKVKVKVIEEKELDVRFVRVSIPINYDDEDMPYDYPMRDGDNWTVLINPDNGQIMDWPQNIEPLDFYIKVRDEGSYYLLGKDMNEIASINQDYAPNELIPGEYGDYVSMKISSTGLIENWPKNPSTDEFFCDEDD